MDYSSGTADQATSGVRINMIPREGGNQLRGTLFATAVNSAFQGEQLHRRAAGPRPAHAQLREDELRLQPGGRRAALGGRAVVLHLGPLDARRRTTSAACSTTRTRAREHWTYEPDSSRPAFANAFQRSVNMRLTWQASQKNKFGFFVDDQGRCQCAKCTDDHAPEAANQINYPIQRMASVSWTSPQTSRVLLEARAGFRGENYTYNGDCRRRSARAADHGHRAGSVNGAPAACSTMAADRRRRPRPSRIRAPTAANRRPVRRRRTSPAPTRPSSASATPCAARTSRSTTTSTKSATGSTTASRTR